jgi:methanogenic corrinoid protein MtbC1
MAAVRNLDGPTVRDALLQSLLTSGVDDTVTDVVMPVLREVGVGWERGDLGVLHEHFVSSTVRGVLGELRMPLQGEQVRTVVLACPPHELHDLPLELFGAMLHARWWRVVSLGANTPMVALGEAVRHLGADACVLAGVRRSAFESRTSSLARLGARVPLFLAGEGAHGLPDPPTGVTVLPRDLRAAAAVVDAITPSTSLRADDRNEPAVG